MAVHGVVSCAAFACDHNMVKGDGDMVFVKVATDRVVHASLTKMSCNWLMM